MLHLKFNKESMVIFNLFHFPKPLIGSSLGSYAARSSSSGRNKSALLKIYSASAKSASVSSVAFNFLTRFKVATGQLLHAPQATLIRRICFTPICKRTNLIADHGTTPYSFLVMCKMAYFLPCLRFKKYLSSPFRGIRKFVFR